MPSSEAEGTAASVISRLESPPLPPAAAAAAAGVTTTITTHISVQSGIAEHATLPGLCRLLQWGTILKN